MESKKCLCAGDWFLLRSSLCKIKADGKLGEGGGVDTCYIFTMGEAGTVADKAQPCPLGGKQPHTEVSLGLNVAEYPNDKLSNI